MYTITFDVTHAIGNSVSVTETVQVVSAAGSPQLGTQNDFGTLHVASGVSRPSPDWHGAGLGGDDGRRAGGDDIGGQRDQLTWSDRADTDLAGKFVVEGEHTYAAPGSYTVSLADGASAATGTQPVQASELSTFWTTPASDVPTATLPLGTLVVVTTLNPQATPADFRVTIDWGDGTPPTAGTLIPIGMPIALPGGSFPGARQFAIADAYPNLGDHRVTITIQEKSGPSEIIQVQTSNGAKILHGVNVIAVEHAGVSPYPAGTLTPAMIEALFNTLPAKVKPRAPRTTPHHAPKPVHHWTPAGASLAHLNHPVGPHPARSKPHR